MHFFQSTTPRLIQSSYSSDYLGFSDAARANLQITHEANGPTVSYEEAQRIERETAEHLLKARKLSLIVDLDQTIVHATVDPTVGDWIAEGEAWEEKHARNEARRARALDKKEKSEDDSDSSDGCGVSPRFAFFSPLLSSSSLSSSSISSTASSAASSTSTTATSSVSTTVQSTTGT